MNPSPAAQQRFLLLQQAYEALRPGGTGGAAGGNPFDRHAHRQREQQQRSAAWRRFWQQPRTPQPIPSETEELDSTSFYRCVLQSEQGDGGGSSTRDGLPFLIQVYSDASPYCRVLSTHWEAAARELQVLAHFGRIDFASQSMLVRFLASHLRLFSGPHPAHELPVVVGFPAGCASMACARVFRGTFSAASLRQFAAEHLLRLPPLPPISPRLLGAWRRAAAAAGPAGSGVALLALVPEGAQPLELLAAIAGAQGHLHAVAAVVWRPTDRALWADAVGATSAPALVFWHSSAERPSAVVQGSLPTNSIDWAAEIGRHARPTVPLLTAASAAQQLPACRLSASAAEGPPSALCVLLLGQGRQLAAARARLEALHSELSSGGSRVWTGRGRSPEQRQAGEMLAQGLLQLAWTDSSQQQALCRHLVLWGGSPAHSSCLCGPRWRLGALFGQQQQQTVLLAYRLHPTGRHGQLLIAAYQGGLEAPQQVVAWLAAIGDSSRQGRLLRPAPPLDVPLARSADARPALAALLLPALHLASRAELLWQQAAGVVAAAVGHINWWLIMQVAMTAGALLGLKWVLDLLSGSDEELAGGGDASPARECRHRRHCSTLPGSSAVSVVREMQLSDWEPSPGRFLVVLPLHTASGATRAQQAQQAQQHFASLAAVFRNERRLAFRLAPVSGALLSLLAAGSSNGSNSSTGSGVPQREQQWGEQHQDPPDQARAIILHPRRGGRFQLLRLTGMQQAVLRLGEVLGGGGQWWQGAPAGA
ncbi:hypothetical protein ABPG75_004746 [Micractinium tetrahymenae]